MSWCNGNGFWEGKTDAIMYLHSGCAWMKLLMAQWRK